MINECTKSADIIVIVEPPEEINLIVEKSSDSPVVTVEIPGIQGASRVDEPFDIDPTEVYLESRGTINVYNEN